MRKPPEGGKGGQVHNGISTHHIIFRISDLLFRSGRRASIYYAGNGRSISDIGCHYTDKNSEKGGAMTREENKELIRKAAPILKVISELAKKTGEKISLNVSEDGKGNLSIGKYEISNISRESFSTMYFGEERIEFEEDIHQKEYGELEELIRKYFEENHEINNEKP